MSSDMLIRASGLGKKYEIFSRPSDRLLQLVAAPLAALVGAKPRQRGREMWALRDVSFEVARGETLGIVGRNGSGKSTLLQMLCGTLTPTVGTSDVRGRIAALLELGAGFNPEFTGRENVFLNGMLLGLAREAIEQRFDQIAAFADIGPYIDEPTKTYSSGMFVRLAFAVATSVDADVLIVDEALAVGDARFQARCMKRIRQIQDQGASVLFVSHDVSTVRTLCQRALWLDGGNMRMLGPVLQVTARYMEAIFADDPDAAGQDELASSSSPGPHSDDGAAPMPEPDSGATLAPIEVAQSCPGTKALADAFDETRLVVDDGPGTDSRPVSHWGEEVGLIRSTHILDASGNAVEMIRWGETCKVRIRFVLPDSYTPESFGVAFSIKDLKGSDIIVSSTHDTEEFAGRAWEPGDEVQVEFQFENGLVEGKYFLVAALERRTGPVIEYYEYLEGARYFSSIAPKRFFGVYQPRMAHRFAEVSSVR